MVVTLEVLANVAPSVAGRGGLGWARIGGWGDGVSTDRGAAKPGNPTLPPPPRAASVGRRPMLPQWRRPGWRGGHCGWRGGRWWVGDRDPPGAPPPHPGGILDEVGWWWWWRGSLGYISRAAAGAVVGRPRTHFVRPVWRGDGAGRFWLRNATAREKTRTCMSFMIACIADKT